MLTKIACRLPQYLARAAAGDPVAIAMLAVTGGVALYEVIKQKRN